MHNISSWLHKAQVVAGPQDVIGLKHGTLHFDMPQLCVVQFCVTLVSVEVFFFMPKSLFV